MKKLLSLTLALLMTLSLAACGSKSEPTPEPHTGVEAIIAYALHGDAEGLRAAYGFDSAQEAVDALAQGADLRTVMADSLLDTLADSDMAPSEPTLERLTQSILDLLGRMEFSCRTLSREGDTAVVEVTVSTLPADTFTDGLTGYATPRVMESLDKITDEQSAVELTFQIMCDYFDQLQSAGTATFEQTVTLTAADHEGKTLSVWGSDAEGGELGNQLVLHIFGQGFIGS